MVNIKKKKKKAMGHLEKNLLFKDFILIFAACWTGRVLRRLVPLKYGRITGVCLVQIYDLPVLQR